ncbi:hypothetical protein SCLCIDRAFT_108159 [Scleroderma citrinum Foug A]|uniref:F-box domain-containing protein n=1 Tax=Scleroderma citrinum Foug A TaxID=1036808 RepID=A0A0C3EGG9_9AGAM|nr:hypothetical protein SCLCIDRAFT_108159 [Scleroderma citrinum Foug A]
MVIPKKGCLLMGLPPEILSLIVNFLSATRCLWALLQVCKLFQELASPSYFCLIGLEVSQADGWVKINDANCSGLLLWRHLSSFISPKFFWFSGSHSTMDRSFQIMCQFFASLMELQVIPHVNLCFIQGPAKVTPTLLLLLESVVASGCQQLACHVTSRAPIGFSASGNLSTLDITLLLMFKPASIPFMLYLLQNSPLTHLCITQITLNTMQWSSLLRQISLPHLVFLELDMDCPASELASFLASFSRYGSPLVHLGSPQRTSPSVSLPHLTELIGSPASLLPLLHQISVSSYFRRLTVRLDELSSDHSFFSSVLSSTGYFTSLPMLNILLSPWVDSEQEDNRLATCLAYPEFDTWTSTTEVLNLRSYSHTSALVCCYAVNPSVLIVHADTVQLLATCIFSPLLSTNSHRYYPVQ